MIVSGYNSKNYKVIVCPNLTSCPASLESIDDFYCPVPNLMKANHCWQKNVKPQPFTDTELYDLVRDLILTKKRASLVDS